MIKDILLGNGIHILSEIQIRNLSNFRTSCSGVSYSKIKSLFNLSDTSPGTYILKVLSQGSPALYINPGSLEKQIEIIEVNGVKEVRIIEESSNVKVDETIGVMANETINITQITNETIQTTTQLGNVTCKEFQENVLWSSGYTTEKDSINYQIWYPEYNCSEINSSSCFIKNINLWSRSLSGYYYDNKTEGTGYIQISELENVSCNTPEKGVYSEYIIYEKLGSEEVKKGKYCKKGKDNECELPDPLDYFNYSNCYGIKAYASPYLIIDVFSVNYTLCQKVNVENET